MTTPFSSDIEKIKPDVLRLINSLHIPTQLYASISVSKDTLEIAEVSRESTHEYKSERLVKQLHEGVVSYLKNEAKRRNSKYIAVELSGHHSLRDLIPRLWLQEDIVTFLADHSDGRHVTETVKDITANFSEKNIVYVQVEPSNEVQVSELIDFKDYETVTESGDLEQILYLAKQYKGKKLSFFSATPQGGGVALMRHALIRLYKLLGVDAHWYVLIPNSDVFLVTKTKFHNVLQNVAAEGTELTEDEMDLFDKWSSENAAKFEKVFVESDVIVIDDPQPSGLIPHIKKINPKVKIIFRSHIQIVGKLASTEGTAQRKTWNFIWERIKEADLFVSHPIKEFIPVDVPKEKIVYMPATTDPLDGLNKPLSETQIAYYMKLFNQHLLVYEGQTPLDLHRPYMIQIARFDPSKGIPDVIESYREFREMLKKYDKKEIPQLVIAGNASIDDPDGVPVYNATLDLLRSHTYRDLAGDVKIARLPHIDQMLNALLRKSHVVLQLSTKEGFEIKVTEGLMKGKPLIAYRTGGIPWQIEEGVNGFLVETGGTTQVAEHLYDLFTNEELYQKMSQAASSFANKDYLTIPNAINWLFLSEQLLQGNELGGHYAWVKDLANRYYEERMKRGIFSKLLSLSHRPSPFLSVKDE